MKVRQDKKLSGALLTLNAVLGFIVAFLLGTGIAAAQIKYFDEPESPVVKNPLSANTQTKTAYTVTGDSPYTAQFPEFKDQLDSTITPENPGPNTSVSIQVAIYSFDINSAEITWKKDGKVVAEGIGKKNYTFVTGNSGVTTKIEVSIDPKDRPVITNTYSFTPGDVDMLWQADTYSHPFYKGKNMYTPEADVQVVAMPRTGNGTIQPNQTIFNWIENYEHQADKSGIGRNYYLYSGPILMRPVNISVEAYSPKPGSASEKQVAVGDITLKPSGSGALLYEDNPAFGTLFNKALIGSTELNKSELQVAVYPYFHSTQNKNLGLEYSWVIDGNKVDLPKDQNTISLKKTTGESGNSSVFVQISNPFKILQSVNTGFTLTFNKKSSSASQSTFGE